MSEKINWGNRRISLENARLIGKGFASRVYELDNGDVVKVLRSGTRADAEREIALAKWAFRKGLPTAISYDVIDADGQPGLVFESLGRGNLRNVFRDHPEESEAMMVRYLDLLRTINSIRDDEELLPSAAEKYRAALATIADLLTPEENTRMSALLDSIPYRPTLIHGDCQIKNVRVMNGELYLIDLDTLSRGNPIFELAALFCCYRGYSDLDDSGSDFDSFFEIPKKVLDDLLDRILNDYVPGLSEAEKLGNRKKVALLAYMYMMYNARVDVPGDERAAALMAQKFRAALADGVTDLSLAL